MPYRDRLELTITSPENHEVFIYNNMYSILIFSVVLYRPTPRVRLDRFIATHPLSNALKPKVKPIITSGVSIS